MPLPPLDNRTFASKPSRIPSVRRAKYAGKNTVRVSAHLPDLRALLKQVEGDIHRAVRPAAQAAAEVFYRAALKNVQALGATTGNLRSSIYQVFSKDHSTEVPDGYARATYHVSWNAREAPHGHLIEYGHIQKFKVYLGKDGRWYTNKKAPLAAPKQVAARPFMRTALNAAEAADAAAQKAFHEAMRGAA